jgi:hypothetical protein
MIPQVQTACRSLGDNQINGTIPDFLQEITPLSILYDLLYWVPMRATKLLRGKRVLSGNQLEGSIPSALAALPSLRSMYVASWRVEQR